MTIPITVPQIAQIVVAAIVADGDPISHGRDTRRCPRHPFRLFTLVPRPNGALENHFVAVCLDADAVCVELRVSLDRFFDPAPNVYWLGQGLYSDRVGDALDSW